MIDLPLKSHALTDVPEEVEGAPAGFQLVGRPYKDEELVAIAPAVMEAVGVPDPVI
jgi:Asp-tRNA(Asn)/Glu-tRNA(Gln) amidotransferase A subunit family amidase